MEVQEVFPLNSATVQPPRFSVAVSNGSVLVVPLSQGQISGTQLHQIPTHVLNEQLVGPNATGSLPTGHVTATSLPQTISTITEHFAGPTHVPVSTTSSCDGFTLSTADEGLADLQPEDSEGEEEGSGAKADLTPEQKKLEFMAALNLVPPAILEEIRRRQQLCRAEYGNWWDRLHSTDFCLVAKSDSALTNLQSLADLSQATATECPPVIPAEDQTHVATGPDADSLVEQITYLTSWPQPTTSQPSNTVEVMTTPTPTSIHENQIIGTAHLASEEQPLHVTLQHVNNYH